MFANRVLVAVACCVLLACAPARAADPKPMKPPVPPVLPKFPTVIRLEVLEPAEVAATLCKGPNGGLAQLAVIEPLPDEKALLIYADAKWTNEIKKVLLLLGEPPDAPKRAHAIPVPAVLEFKETVKTVKKLFPVKTVILPLDDEHALLAYVTDTQAKEIRASLRLLAEPVKPAAPPPMSAPRAPGTAQPVTPAKAPQPRTFAVYFKDAKWDEVFDWYAKETGLTLITVVKPKGTFTFTPPKDARFTVAEFTDAVNDALAAQKFILIRRHMTFYLHDWTEKLEARDRAGMFPRITPSELPNRGRTELVQVVLVIKRADELAVVDELKKLSGAFGYLVPLSNGMLVVQDTAGNVAKIKKRLDELDAPKPMPLPAAPPPMTAPQPPGAVQPVTDPGTQRPDQGKRYTINFSRVQWEDVLAWYAKETGLKADIREKPPGAVTIKPGKDRKFTLGEITDLLNEALTQQKLYLFRGTKSFVVVRADQKIDPKLIPAVEMYDLHTRGRTELVEVAMPLKGDIDDADAVIDELKKLTTPLGEILYAKGKWVVIRDTVGNILRIREMCQRVCAAPRTHAQARAARRDAPKPMPEPTEEQAPKKLGVIRDAGLNVDEAVPLLRELLPPDIGIARFPLFNALVVWGTDEEIRDIRHALTLR